MTDWSEDDVPDQSGRTAVVTGANSGLGFHAARTLAARGAHVVMACRSERKGRNARQRILDESPDASLELEHLDLASLSSIRRFAGRYEGRHDDLHVLLNNAGVMAIPRSETEDGFELQFGVNHLGHYALTGLLIGVVVETADRDGDARVVTVSSEMHRRGKIDFTDLHGREGYGKWRAYSQSKLANLLFAYELQRRLEDAGTDARSLGCHPGWAATNLQRRGPELMGSTARLLLMKALNTLLGQPAERGALPLLYAATMDVEGGCYVGPDGFMNRSGSPEVQRSSDKSYDVEAAERLWRVSEDLTGVEYGLKEKAEA